MTRHDRGEISELIVLSLLRDGPRSIRELRGDLLRLIERQPNREAFVLGPHASFRDFLMELYAAGAVRLLPRAGDVVVQLTEHGRREWLDKLPSNVRKRYAFAFA